MARAGALVILGALLLRAQEPMPEVVIHTHSYTPPGTVLHAETNLVEAGLTVWDHRGAPSPACKHRISISSITVFARPSPRSPNCAPMAGPPRRRPRRLAGHPPTTPAASVPLRPPKYVTFFFDDFHTDNSAMLFVKKAAHTFIENGMGPSDWMSIVTASGQGDLDFTNDAARFAERIDHLAPHIRPVVPSPCGVSPVDSYIFLHNLDGDIREEAIAAAQVCLQCNPNDPSGTCRLALIGIAQQAASSAWEQLRAQSLDTMDALGFAAKSCRR